MLLNNPRAIKIQADNKVSVCFAASVSVSGSLHYVTVELVAPAGQWFQTQSKLAWNEQAAYIKTLKYPWNESCRTFVDKGGFVATSYVANLNELFCLWNKVGPTKEIKCNVTFRTSIL